MIATRRCDAETARRTWLRFSVEKNENGFTLLGALLGMVIFVLGILGVFSMQSLGIASSAHSLRLTEENAWAQDALEDLVGFPYDDPDKEPPYAPGENIDPLEPVDYEDGSNGGGFVHELRHTPYTVKWVVFTAAHNGRKINDFPAIRNDEMFDGSDKDQPLQDIPPNAKLVIVCVSHPRGPVNHFVFVKPKI